jgi:hypothetical protein
MSGRTPPNMPLHGTGDSRLRRLSPAGERRRWTSWVERVGLAEG